jgi:hypothetical protein
MRPTRPKLAVLELKGRASPDTHPHITNPGPWYRVQRAGYSAESVPLDTLVRWEAEGQYDLGWAKDKPDSFDALVQSRQRELA